MEKIKTLSKSTSETIYENYYSLTILWLILTLMVFLETHYGKCLNKLSFKNGLENIFIGLTVLFSVMIVFFLYVPFSNFSNIKAIENKKKQLCEDDISDSFHDRKYSQYVGQINNFIFILIIPLFYIWVLAISKMIIYSYFLSKVNYKVYLLVWVVIFIFTFWLWFKLKYKAYKKYNIGYVVLVSIYTLSIIFWDNLLPYIKELILLKECIVTEIMMIDSVNNFQ